jgi:hypothetical protein
METRYSNAYQSVYGMGDVLAFMLKGDAPAFVMGDATVFMIKGDTPLATCVSFTCIIGDARLPFIREADTSRI